MISYKIFKPLLVIFISYLCFSCNNSDQISDETINIKELVSGENSVIVNQIIDGKNVPRRVYIKVPINFDKKIKYPVVFAFHGAGGNGDQFLNNWSLNQLINSGEFIGVYPNGHATNYDGNSGFWNLGNERTNADDVEFVDFIMEELQKHPELNKNKVYAIGLSNGSGMVNLLGKSTNYFNAIAPLFSQQLVKTGNIIANKSLSVFQVNGEFDEMIPIQGGTSPVGEFMSAEQSALNWVNQFGCSTSFLEESLNWGSTSIKSFTYLSCESQNQIKYLIALNTGHGWQDDQARNTSFAEIWSFFKLH